MITRVCSGWHNLHMIIDPDTFFNQRCQKPALCVIPSTRIILWIRWFVNKYKLLWKSAVHTSFTLNLELRGWFYSVYVSRWLARWSLNACCNEWCIQLPPLCMRWENFDGHNYSKICNDVCNDIAISIHTHIWCLFNVTTCRTSPKCTEVVTQMYVFVAISRK